MNNERLLFSIGDIADKYITEAEPKTAKVVKLFKKPLVLVAAVAVFLLLCAFTAYVVYNHIIAFPVNEDGKADYNLHIFDTAFTLSVDLPEGVSIDFDSTLFPNGISGVFSNVAIINTDGGMVGCVGYNVYDMAQLSDISEDEFNPLMIYNQIGLGAHYSFWVREKYEVVNATDEWETAITYVYNDLDISPEERMDYTEDKYNYGIVSYCKTLPVYVAFDFKKDVFTQEQIETIAKSIAFAHLTPSPPRTS